MSTVARRRACEDLIVAVIDAILSERGFAPELLLLPQRDLGAHDLLRDGQVPADLVDAVLTGIDQWTTSMLAQATAAVRVVAA